ncbi:hypothetical protein C8R43DRAFT_1206920 [Mycena crocata]|nr:hypothetical protein C8R43DRAFT_1206920 [Mycena crocata]
MAAADSDGYRTRRGFDDTRCWFGHDSVGEQGFYRGETWTTSAVDDDSSIKAVDTLALVCFPLSIPRNPPLYNRTADQPTPLALVGSRTPWINLSTPLLAAPTLCCTPYPASYLVTHCHQSLSRFRALVPSVSLFVHAVRRYQIHQRNNHHKSCAHVRNVLLPFRRLPRARTNGRQSIGCARTPPNDAQPAPILSTAPTAMSRRVPQPQPMAPHLLRWCLPIDTNMHSTYRYAIPRSLSSPALSTSLLRAHRTASSVPPHPAYTFHSAQSGRVSSHSCGVSTIRSHLQSSIPSGFSSAHAIARFIVSPMHLSRFTAIASPSVISLVSVAGAYFLQYPPRRQGSAHLNRTYADTSNLFKAQSSRSRSILVSLLCLRMNFSPSNQVHTADVLISGDGVAQLPRGNQSLRPERD